MKPDWMTDDDIHILELLAETDASFTPKGMAFSLPAVNYYTIGNRLPVLKDRGFVEFPEQKVEGVDQSGVYKITDLGRRFLNGDITLAELRDEMG